MPPTPDLTKKPERLKTVPSKGIKAKDSLPAIDRDGGDFGAGIIRGASLITRGEALGHGAWVDNEFLDQVETAVNAAGRTGTKARFTHPSLSGDGLGSYLGRWKNAFRDGEKTRADLHLSQAAHNTPDGDLAAYVMDLADEDPEAFAVSIAFYRDFGAEDRHRVQFEDEEGDFHSPDADNANNYPHFRLRDLRAGDVVDEPAANPDGLFHRGQEVAEEADALLSFAIGISNEAPAVAHLEVDPDRTRGFVTRFLEHHGLSIIKKGEAMPPKNLEEQEPTVPATEPENPADQPAENGKESPADKPVETPSEQPTGQSADDPKAEVKRYLSAFGTDGATWFADGLSYEQAQDKYIAKLKADLDTANKRLAALGQQGEAAPVSFQSDSADGGGKPQPAADSKLAKSLGPNLAKFAAGIKFAKK